MLHGYHKLFVYLKQNCREITYTVEIVEDSYISYFDYQTAECRVRSILVRSWQQFRVIIYFVMISISNWQQTIYFWKSCQWFIDILETEF